MNTGDVLGVDGCRAGWIAARLSPGSARFLYSIHSSFARLLEAHADVGRIAVDIPIGLSECFVPRPCDKHARSILKARGASVFPAPDRRLLKFSSYAEANEFSRQHCSRGLSQQCFHIFKKIDQVDRLISPAMQGRILEVHPEVSFWAASGRQPLEHSKRTSGGYEERSRILSRVFPGTPIPMRQQIRLEVPGATSAQVQPDDILDAMIAAWTALRHSRNEHQRLPPVPEHDSRGLRMEIVF